MTLDEARHALMGYRDDQPGTPEDALRLAEVREQAILSYQKSITFLSARLKLADPSNETVAVVVGD